MNVLTLAGRLGQAPRVATLASGDVVINLNVAVDQRIKGSDGAWKNETLWFDVSMFGKRGTALASFLVKGQWVGATGEFRPRRYTNRAGVETVANELMARDIWPLGKPAGAEAGAGGVRATHRDQLQPDRSFRGAPPPQGMSDFEMPPDDDIPF
jgi:single-strand DNA-binding protein